MDLTAAAGAPLPRLGALSPAERALYPQLFRAAGGGGAAAAAPSKSAAALLQRSGLPQDVLHRVWRLADRRGGGGLDFEDFCAACRLCAHAQQQLPWGAAQGGGGPPLGEAAIAQAPPAPPRFGGADAAAGGRAAFDFEASSRAGAAAFDFEAAAFGVDGGARGYPSRPPVPSMAVELGASASRAPVPPALGFGGEGRGGAGPGPGSGSRPALKDGGGFTAGGEKYGGAEDSSVEGCSSAAKLVGALCAEGGSGTSRGRSQADRLSAELLDARRGLDARCTEKAQLEQRIERTRARLEACRSERQSTSGKLACHQADLEHLWATLEFVRQQIQEAERETAEWRDARRAFSAEELAGVERRFGRLTGGQALSGPDDGEGESGRGAVAAAEAALAARERAAQDTRSAVELGERARRASRQKLELQARQQLLLAAQQQAEQERSYAQRELELARSALGALQRDRLALGRERLAALRQAERLAREVGLGPGVVRELLGPGAAPPAMAPAAPAPAPAREAGHPGPGAGAGRARGRVAAGLAGAAAEAEAPPSAMLGASPAGAAGAGKGPRVPAGWTQFGDGGAEEGGPPARGLPVH